MWSVEEGVAKARYVAEGNPSRYPACYAADFVRVFAYAVPIELRNGSVSGRQQALRIIEAWAQALGQDPVAVQVQLADAYLDRVGMHLSSYVKNARLTMVRAGLSAA